MAERPGERIAQIVYEVKQRYPLHFHSTSTKNEYIRSTLPIRLFKTRYIGQPGDAEFYPVRFPLSVQNQYDEAKASKLFKCFNVIGAGYDYWEKDNEYYFLIGVSNDGTPCGNHGGAGVVHAVVAQWDWGKV